MNTKNAFSTLLTVLITAVAVGVLTGVISYSYAISKKDIEIEDLKEQLSQVSSSIPSAPSNADTDEIKDLSSKSSATEAWKTYTNEKYGFSFKYPDKWSIVADKIPSDLTLQKQSKIEEGIDISGGDIGNINEDRFRMWINPVGFGTESDSDYWKCEIKNGKIMVIDKHQNDYLLNGGVSCTGLKDKDFNYFISYNFNLNERVKKLDTFDQILFTFQFTSDKEKSSSNSKSETLMSFPEDNNPSTRNSVVSFEVPNDWLRKNEKFYNAGSLVEYYTNGSGMTKMMTAYTQDVQADFGTSKQGITTQKTTVNNYSVYKWTEKDGAVTYSFEAENGQSAYKFTFDKGVDIKIIDQVVNSVSY